MLRKSTSLGTCVVSFSLALFYCFNTVLADEADWTTLPLDNYAVHAGEYLELEWYRELKLDVARYLNPDVIDNAAIMYKYELNDISDELCDSMVKQLDSGHLAFAIDMDSKYDVFVPSGYTNYVVEKGQIEDDIFAKYLDQPEYEQFVEDTVVPAYMIELEQIGQTVAAQIGEIQAGTVSESTYGAISVIAEMVSERVAPAYREFFASREDEDYERYVQLLDSLSGRKLVEHDEDETGCFSYWVDDTELRESGNEYGVVFLGIMPNLFEGRVAEKVITWDAGQAVVPMVMGHGVDLEAQYGIPQGLLEKIAKKAIGAP